MLPLSYWVLTWLILRSWRRVRHIPQKFLFWRTARYNIAESRILCTVVVRTSNPTTYYLATYVFVYCLNGIWSREFSMTKVFISYSQKELPIYLLSMFIYVNINTNCYVPVSTCSIFIVNRSKVKESFLTTACCFETNIFKLQKKKETKVDLCDLCAGASLQIPLANYWMPEPIWNVYDGNRSLLNTYLTILSHFVSVAIFLVSLPANVLVNTFPRQGIQATIHELLRACICYPSTYTAG
jgi:hypothetical protein